MSTTSDVKSEQPILLLHLQLFKKMCWLVCLSFSLVNGKQLCFCDAVSSVSCSDITDHVKVNTGGKNPPQTFTLTWHNKWPQQNTLNLVTVKIPQSLLYYFILYMYFFEEHILKDKEIRNDELVLIATSCIFCLPVCSGTMTSLASWTTLSVWSTMLTEKSSHMNWNPMGRVSLWQKTPRKNMWGMD